MSRRATTISHVASKCGVSLQTVSNVLNGRAGQASVETHERVMSAARELNYFPSAVARGLARKRMNTIGVALSTFSGSVISHEYAGPILDGALDAMTAFGQNAMLFTGHMYADPEESLPAYCDGRCDGLLLVSAFHGVTIAKRMLKAAVPFVLIGVDDMDERIPWIDIDHDAAAFKMASFLIDAGHTGVAFLCGHDQVYGSRQRQAGYERAMDRAGLEIDDGWIVPGTFTIESGFERTLSLFQQPCINRPTALFCASDAIALGAIKALGSMGLRVPQDVSVAGFDDAAPAAVCDPPLTTIRQPIREMGRLGVEMILDIINHQHDIKRHVCLDAALIVRKSVAPPPRTS